MPCSPGHYAPLQGMSVCLTCAEGQFAPDNGSATYDLAHFSLVFLPCLTHTRTCRCLPCPAGQSSNQQGVSVCEDCQPGTYTDVPSSTLCQICPAGQFNTRYGALFCDPCRCDAHFHCVAKTPLTCNGRENSEPNDNHTACLCSLGKHQLYFPLCTLLCSYNFHPCAGFYDKNGECLPCPEGGDCSVRGVITPLPGWWQSRIQYDKFYECFSEAVRARVC